VVESPKAILKELPVMETFLSIQGEGFHSGKIASFIRLAGCDVGCHWCDVKESWNSKEFGKRKIEELAHEMFSNKSPITIITGGEPLLYDLAGLCLSLKGVGQDLHLETSGVYPLSGAWDWICISPKKFKPARPEILQEANELKLVVFNHSDLEWAESFESQVNGDCKLFLQPEWSKRDKMMPLIVEFCKSHPHWRISLQIHKYMGVQ
jgi:7-carboxy-7-deazaguanine synthase